MASKRVVSGKGRPGVASASGLAPSDSSQLRPRSGLGRPVSANKELEEDPVDQMSQRPAQASTETSEHNIKVVVRCRRRSEKEIADSSPIVVQTYGAQADHLIMEVGTPTSIMGVISLPEQRKYSYDKVFGPEADQAMVYREVVKPMLEEVLAGYSCTLFAYGQTGTGKTHTMQGDIQLNKVKKPSLNAGMIPRAMHQLFEDLESSGTDYNVKISYLELYNEELRDLLANDSTQSSGSTKSAPPPLKIFENSNKKGVSVQGLEEHYVKDFHGAMNLLLKGSERRQIAATNMNAYSSRSHSIFSISVSMKDISSVGGELFRVGKLNLVDLAGSENVGKSGAENERLQEASLINRSLLSLGRVITLLLLNDPKKHIPYRDSKLTRLLQDSLGGRTKTCIIATVSPARSCLEETVSTLDYAMRAKSIRNRPEINHRSTRNVLLKECVAEIDRLRADLLVAREKNGIIIAQEVLDKMQIDAELKQSELDEAKKEIVIVQNELHACREEYEQCADLLDNTTEELKTFKQKVVDLNTVLTTREEEKRQMTMAYEEEVYIREAHAATEEEIDKIALNLRSVASQGTSDAIASHEALGRKVSHFVSTADVISKNTEEIDANTKFLSKAINEEVLASKHQGERVCSASETFKTKSVDALSKRNALFQHHGGMIHDSLNTVLSKENESEESLERVNGLVQDVRNELRAYFKTWSGSTQDALSKKSKELESLTKEKLKATLESIEGFEGVVSAVIEGAEAALSEERKAVERQAEAALQKASEEVVRLRRINEDLSNHLEQERLASIKARDDMIKGMSSMLGDFVEKRHENLRKAFSTVSSENNDRAKALLSYKEEQTSFLSNAATRAENFDDEIERHSKDIIEARDSARLALDDVESSIRTGSHNISSLITEAISLQSGQSAKQEQLLESSLPEFERESKLRRARVRALKNVATEIQNVFKDTTSFNDKMSAEVNDYSSGMLAEGHSILQRSTVFATSSASRVASIRQHNGTITEKISKDIPVTGQTPRKRKWQYVDKWERTRTRQELLDDFRNLNAGKTASLGFNASEADSETRSQSGRAFSQSSDIPCVEDRIEEVADAPEIASDADVKLEEADAQMMYSSRMTSTTANSASGSENSDPTTTILLSAQPSKLAKLRTTDTKITARTRLLRERPMNVADPRVIGKRRR